MFRWGRRVLTAVVFTSLSVLVFSGVAHADNGGAYGTTFVDGGGVISDDFNDHYKELGGSLCNGCAYSKNTDLVVMWQSFLYAERLLGKSGVDGYFGANTATATKAWQGRFGLTKDGKVGPNTWRAAGDRLRWVDGFRTVRYDAKGTDGWVHFHRGATGQSYDSGAYRWESAHNGNSGGAILDKSWDTDKRIHFKKRTITVSSW